jgi:drug/metabolite transporter (DMT)-like permease
MSSQRIALLTLVIASILWAASGTIAKILLPVIDPIPLMMLRVGIAMCVLLPLYLSRKHPPFVKTVKDTWPAILGSIGNFLFFIFGVSYTTANAAAIIYTITPLLTSLLAKKTIQEHTSKKKFMGVALGLVGVLCIILLPMLRYEQSVNGHPFGNILIIFAVFSWTLYIVSSRKSISQQHHDPLTVTTFSMGGTFLVFFFLTLLLPHSPFLETSPATPHLWLLLLYGVGVTAVTFLLHQWAIKHSSATTASLTNYLQPIFAFVYNSMFIGETLSIEFIAGSILVLVGTFLATSEQAQAYKKSLQRARK